jgi:hypothetical protein
MPELPHGRTPHGSFSFASDHRFRPSPATTDRIRDRRCLSASKHTAANRAAPKKRYAGFRITPYASVVITFYRAAATFVGCDKDKNEQPAGARYAFCDEQTIVEITPQTESFDLECIYLWHINEEDIYLPIPLVSVDKTLSTAV